MWFLPPTPLPPALIRWCPQVTSADSAAPGTSLLVGSSRPYSCAVQRGHHWPPVAIERWTCGWSTLRRAVSVEYMPVFKDFISREEYQIVH